VGLCVQYLDGWASQRDHKKKVNGPAWLKEGANGPERFALISMSVWFSVHMCMTVNLWGKTAFPFLLNAHLLLICGAGDFMCMNRRKEECEKWKQNSNDKLNIIIIELGTKKQKRQIPLWLIEHIKKIF